jgi:two-component system, NarL family, sensor histidine kinase LiaS
MMSNAYEDVRNISHNLLPAEFETKGLVGALEKYIHDLNENGKIKFTLKTKGDLSQIDKKIALELYSISMELITNILKHSGASEAEVYIGSSKGKLQLEIKDNGKGLDPEAKQGKGLVQIRERVSGLGGGMEVLSEGGKRVGFRMGFEKV